jgi:drug/metabolite transporter (DMT)-like permease
MWTKVKNVGQITYTVLCCVYWYWLLKPHEIPHGFWANEMLLIMFAGGILFAFVGFILNKQMLTDEERDVTSILAVYGAAAFCAFFAQLLFRGIPDSTLGWALLIIMFFSLAGAVYLLCRKLSSMGRLRK